MQCCVKRFTLLKAIVDKQMTNEYRFLSSELKYRRSLIEIIRRLKSVQLKISGFTHVYIQLFRW